jgi:hypothetical protein
MTNATLSKLSALASSDFIRTGLLSAGHTDSDTQLCLSLLRLA